MRSYLNEDLSINSDKVVRDARILSAISNEDFNKSLKKINGIAEHERYCILLGMCRPVVIGRKFYDFRKAIHKENRLKATIVDGVGILKKGKRQVGVFHDIDEGFLIYDGNLKIWKYDE